MTAITRYETRNRVLGLTVLTDEEEAAFRLGARLAIVSVNNRKNAYVARELLSPRDGPVKLVAGYSVLRSLPWEGHKIVWDHPEQNVYIEHKDLQLEVKKAWFYARSNEEDLRYCWVDFPVGTVLESSKRPGTWEPNIR